MTNPFDRFDPEADLADARATLRQEFEDHVTNVMQIRDLSRPEAECVAYATLLVEHLDRTHPDTPADHCAWCGRAGDLRPTGVGNRHSWVCAGCWESWFEQRQAEAEMDLARLGIVRPPQEEGMEPAEPEPAAEPAEPIEAAKSEPAEALEPAADDSPAEALEPAEPAAPVDQPEPVAEPRRIDTRIRARIIDWPRTSCLHCRKPVIVGQAWIDVTGDEGTARFHRDCLDRWIAAIRKGTNS